MFDTVSAQAQALSNRTSEIVIQAILLATVFFSGAFVDLQTLHGSVRLISWTLPATYGISLLQNIMLRGSTADPTLLLGLTVIRDWALYCGFVAPATSYGQLLAMNNLLPYTILPLGSAR